MKIIILITALIIIILLATKKNYKDLLVFLAICLVLDWIFVNIFSTVPYIRTIAIVMGKPILSVLTYCVIGLICMGIFYYTLQRTNYIISLIVYLIINLIINKFYMTISGSVLIDILFNLIIGIVIILVYRKNIEMEDIKWFAIIGMIINIILTFIASKIWKAVGGTIVILAYFLVPLLMPYIISIIVSAIIIGLIKNRIKEKNMKYEILIYAIIIFICGFIFIEGGNAFLLYMSEKPDKQYVKMNEIYNDKSLIGLSKEEVYKLLGKPKREINNEDENVYIYDAGKITNYLFFGERDFYQLIVNFDKNDKVTSTSIKEIV